MRLKVAGFHFQVVSGLVEKLESNEREREKSVGVVTLLVILSLLTQSQQNVWSHEMKTITRKLFVDYTRE
jgi:hypothetical protein